MFDISFPVAFIGGVVSFFAPCVVPLLPAYVAYVTGVSVQELKDGKGGLEDVGGRYERQILLSSIFYILGFSVIFVVLGTAAAGVGQVLRQYDDVIRIVGGAIILVLGLNFAGFLQIPLLLRLRPAFAEASAGRLPTWTSHLGYGRAFFIGIVFATAWTPCVGAVLGAILSLAAVSQSAVTGASLLFVYSLGISVPFMLVALTLAHAPVYLKVITRHIVFISRAAGLLLAILGILLLTDMYKFVNSWLFEIAFSLGYEIR